MSIEKAILEINPNANFIVTDNNINSIEWIETEAISVADIETKIAEMPTAEEIKTAKATAHASGNTKLLALGLSQEEATALTGYTPSED